MKSTHFLAGLLTVAMATIAVGYDQSAFTAYVRFQSASVDHPSCRRSENRAYTFMDSIRCRKAAMTAPVHSAAPEEYIILDDNSVTFKKRGAGWIRRRGGGYGGTYYHHRKGSARKVSATWNTSRMTPGTYDLYATWVPMNRLEKRLQYHVEDTGTYLKSFTVRQTLHQSEQLAGHLWMHLGEVDIESGDTVKVSIREKGTSVFRADAVMLKRQ